MQRSRYTHIAKEYSPTHRSLQPVASSTTNQPIIGVKTQHIIGGESILVGSIFDVFSCQLL